MPDFTVISNGQSWEVVVDTADPIPYMIEKQTCEGQVTVNCLDFEHLMAFHIDSPHRQEWLALRDKRKE